MKGPISRLFLLSVLVALTVSARAVPDDGPPSGPPPEASQFDFLLGTWNIEEKPNQPGLPEAVRGRWSAQKSADGFMVVDEYRLLDDGGRTVYLGETYRVYSPGQKQWVFRYVEPFWGTWHDGTGVKDGAEMHLTQKGKDGSILKIRYYNISPDRFSWIGQRSKDGGKTWTPGPTIEATRAK